MALGDMILDETGKKTGTRVLPDGKVETSYQSSGKLLGVDINNMTTYWSVLRPDGTFYGEGQGVGMTSDGEAVSWKASGVGKPTGKGFGASLRGVTYFESASQRLARVNGIVGVFEYEMDEDGNVRGKVWEWK